MIVRRGEIRVVWRVSHRRGEIRAVCRMSH
jgi:hypothetical protein